MNVVIPGNPWSQAQCNKDLAIDSAILWWNKWLYPWKWREWASPCVFLICSRSTQKKKRSFTKWGLTLKRQNLRGLNLSLPLRSSRERNSISWAMNTGSEKWSKMICSRCHEREQKDVTVSEGGRMFYVEKDGNIKHACGIHHLAHASNLVHLLSGQVLLWLFLRWGVRH